jgi:hypothetical protein
MIGMQQLCHDSERSCNGWGSAVQQMQTESAEARRVGKLLCVRRS